MNGYWLKTTRKCSLIVSKIDKYKMREPIKCKKKKEAHTLDNELFRKKIINLFLLDLISTEIFRKIR